MMWFAWTKVEAIKYFSIAVGIRLFTFLRTVLATNYGICRLSHIFGFHSLSGGKVVRTLRQI